MDIGDHFNIESSLKGKNENSIKKPFPNKITKKTIKVASNIVVKVSINNDNDIYRLPNKKLNIVKQNNKYIKSIMSKEMDMKDKYTKVLKMTTKNASSIDTIKLESIMVVLV